MIEQTTRARSSETRTYALQFTTLTLTGAAPTVGAFATKRLSAGGGRPLPLKTGVVESSLPPEDSDMADVAVDEVEVLLPLTPAVVLVLVLMLVLLATEGALLRRLRLRGALSPAADAAVLLRFFALLLPLLPLLLMLLLVRVLLLLLLLLLATAAAEVELLVSLFAREAAAAAVAAAFELR